MARIIKGGKWHRVGRLKSPITHLMGTAFQSQHVGDLSNQDTLHGKSNSGRVKRASKRRGGSR